MTQSTEEILNRVFDSSTNTLKASVADGAITAAKLATDAVETLKIKDANVTVDKMAANSVDSDQYVDGSIDPAHFAASAVETAAINDGAITNAKLSTTAGEVGGTWVAWTPTWTNLVVTGSTVNAKWTQVGKTIIYKITVTLGDGNKPSGGVDFTTPTSIVSTPDVNTAIGECVFSDTGTTAMLGYIFQSGTTKGLVRVGLASGTYNQHAGISSSVPFTWTDGDFFHASGSYETS